MLFRKALSVPMRYVGRWAKATIAAIVLNDDLNVVYIETRRRVIPTDLKKGKLKPIVHIRLEGKMVATTTAYSYESAELLYQVLGEALKDQRKRHAEYEGNMWLKKLLCKHFVSEYLSGNRN